MRWEPGEFDRTRTNHVSAIAWVEARPPVQFTAGLTDGVEYPCNTFRRPFGPIIARRTATNAETWRTIADQLAEALEAVLDSHINADGSWTVSPAAVIVADDALAARIAMDGTL